MWNIGVRVKSALDTKLFDDKCKEHDEMSSKFVVPYLKSHSKHVVLLGHDNQSDNASSFLIEEVTIKSNCQIFEIVHIFSFIGVME